MLGAAPGFAEPEGVARCCCFARSNGSAACAGSNGRAASTICVSSCEACWPEVGKSGAAEGGSRLAQSVKRAETYQLEGITVHTIALEDLIRVKEHIDREKDRESLRQLWALREWRAMQKDQGKQ